MQSAFDNMAHRSGPLGTGATVVRTPQEALAGPLLETGSFHGVESDHEPEQSDDDELKGRREVGQKHLEMRRGIVHGCNRK